MTADVGLATERTALAWRRTAIGSMGVALLLLHHAAVRGGSEARITPLAAAITMIAVGLLCFERNRTLRRGKHGHGRAVIASTALAVVAVSVLAAVLEFTDPTI
ncbi:DUF202 domain-containing protein [Nocardia arizonensis]|uniref:DUF202 domain-containing protein n=1 Tax=Nocardia arizonensis TaxID=1141647 RepID=UPI0006D2C58A|nr:DUF202 domain-containing protein [Nocardia arizonensis]